MATAFDPSVISQIPDMAPNPIKATQDAYSLYDTKNRVQMNALTLQQAKEEEADKQATKKILQGSDISTDKGVNEAAEKIAKVAPDQAMKFKKEMTAQKNVDLDNQMKQLQVMEQQTIPMINSLDSVISGLQPMRQLYEKGQITKAELDAATQNRAMQASNQLMQNNPEVAPFVQKFLQNKGNLTYDGLLSVENSTKQGREMAKARLAEMKEAANELKSERQSAQTDRRLDIQEKAMESLVKRRDVENKNDEAGHITPETAKFMAGQYIAGDKSVLSGMGRTKGDMAMARNAITELANEPKWGPNHDRPMTPAELAGKLAQFQADQAELRKISNISGAVEYASSELTRFIPLALKASDAVPRGEFVPFNKLLQMGAKNISDPNLKRLYVNTQGIMNAYDVLAARSGGSDAHKRAINREQLATADSPAAYKAALDAMKQELDVAAQAGSAAQKSITDRIAGNSSDAPEAPKVGTVMQGYKFKGGDPADQKSWEKVK
jgi:hypothetical protein